MLVRERPVGVKIKAAQWLVLGVRKMIEHSSKSKIYVSSWLTLQCVANQMIRENGLRSFNKKKVVLRDRSSLLMPLT